MPRKKRHIRRAYRKAGFTERAGKGDHTVYSHPLLRDQYVVAGIDGKDALPYDEANLRAALQALADAHEKRKGTQP